MPMSERLHPTRDALHRDSLNQLREQRGVTIVDFAKELNESAYVLAESKMAKWPRLSGMNGVDPDLYFTARNNWSRQVERWASGDTEFPAWLEEPWVAALDALGDEGNTRLSLVARHGLLGVQIPTSNVVMTCGFEALASISDNTGDVLKAIAAMLPDGVLNELDSPMAPEALEKIHDALGSLIAASKLIRRDVLGETVQ